MFTKQFLSEDIITNDPGCWFPGRWMGGISMILAPMVLLTGVLLRIQFHFFFSRQLAAFKGHPALLVISYNFFVAGNILMFPAIITLARLVGQKRKQWALWGGTLVILGLFARTFHAGVDHLVFQLANLQGLKQATGIVAGSHSAFNIMGTLNGAKTRF